MYQEGVQREETIVSVSTDDGRIDDIADVLNRCDAKPIDKQAAQSQVNR